MPLKKMLAWTVALCVCIPAANASAQQLSVLKTEKEKTSYAIGVDLARKFQRQGIDADTDALLKGMRDVLSRSTLLMTDEDLQQALNEFQTDLKYKRARSMKYVAEENRSKGSAFLAENRSKEGVVTLPSGLQYRVLAEGAGPKPTEKDTVAVKYKGLHIDGTEFDSSSRRGQQPATFSMSSVIPGWKEALQLMPVGSKWQLFIPPELAYGVQGHAYGARSPIKDIGPSETLVYELELVAIK